MFIKSGNLVINLSAVREMFYNEDKGYLRLDYSHLKTYVTHDIPMTKEEYNELTSKLCVFEIKR